MSKQQIVFPTNFKLIYLIIVLIDNVTLTVPRLQSSRNKSLNSISIGSSRELSKRQADKCQFNINIHDCKAENLAKTLSTRRTNRFVAIFQSNCIYETKYDWAINKRDSGQQVLKLPDSTENVLVVEPYTLGVGYHDAVATVHAFRNGFTTTKSAKCQFNVGAEKPIPIIAGGTHRNVEPDKSFIVDGSKSIDTMSSPNKPGHLQFQWMICRIIDGKIDRKNGCQPSADQKDKIEIHEGHATMGAEYYIELKVKNRNSNNWTFTEQWVKVVENVVELEIICEKNCLPVVPKTDSERETVFRAKCLKNCNGIDEDSFKWTVDNIPLFDYEKHTQSGRYTDKFIIKPGTFTPGMEYRITLTLKSEKPGSVTNTIVVHTPPSIESCQVKPPEGTALETKFRVACKYKGDDIFSEIYTVTKDNKVQIARSVDINSLEFFLPANTKPYIRIVDSDGSFKDYQLTVNVKAAATAVDGDDGLKRAIILNERIEKLMQEKNLEEAIQVTNGLMEEMDKKSPKPEHKKIRKDILKNFKKFRIKSKESARQIASMVNKVVHTNEGESDPYQGELATSLCAQAARVDLEYLEKESFPTTFSTDAKETTKTYMQCGEVDTKANFEMLKANPLLFGMTTSFPMLSLPVISEDYPDYESDETVLDKREKYEHASENYVDICNTNLKMMALVMVEDEDTMIATTSLSSTQVTRLIGTKLAESTVEAKGAAIKPSADFNKVTTPVDVMVCSWSKDPFWWNLQKRVVITNVILLKMLKNKKEIVTFTKPNRIILDVSDSDKYVNIHEVEDDGIIVIRINVRKREAFFLEFHNLNTGTFRVMITEFSKPDSDKVQEQGQLVSKENSNFYHEHNQDHHSWYYITLVPTNKALGKIKFSVSVYSMSCYSWNMTKKEWQFACKGNFNSSEKKLKCYCDHLSILAGMVYNIPIKVEHVLKLDFAMSLIHSYIIFITVCVTFGLYCFVLLLHVFKKGTIGRNVYLPADISSSFLYVYLVKIRTGKRPLSGTSSTICIKLASARYRSKRHVLNYPDPQRRIFQWGGEDWFVIPTRHYMGTLLEISLWSDYSGRKPSWFCSDVTIYDLQTNQRWFFKLNAWFGIPPNGQIFVTAKPTEEENKERVVVTALTRIWPRWSHQAGFSIFKKMTILLSTVLTIFLIAFVMYGLPKLRMNDGFIVVYKYGLYPHVILIALGSSITTFIFHIPLTWLFKKRIQNGLCWGFLCINIILSLSVLIVFGFWIPLVTGWLWLTSVVIATIIYFFIFENIYEKVSSILFKSADDIELFSKLKSLVLAIEEQRRYLFESFGEDLFRPYFTHLYEPLDEEDIKERKLQQESRYKLMMLVEDTIMVACYITLLYLAIYANRNVWSVKSHQELMLLTNGVHNRTMDTSTIKSIDAFYNYINLSLIPNLQAEQWYWKFVIKDPGNMRDFQNKYLGVVRLRQQRAKLYDCKVPRIMKFFSKGDTCRSEFWTAKRDLNNFGAHLNKFRMTQVWKFTKSKTAGISLVVGKFGAYSGGGFIAPLGRTKYNSMVNLDYLKKRHWLDNATGVVFVEFLTYNVNTNLFNAVRITVERSVTGYFRVVVDIKTAQLLFVRKEDELAGVTIFGSFFLVVFIFTVKILSRLWKGKLLFFKDFWSLIDLSIVALSYGCFALYMHRAKLVGHFLEKLDKAKKNQFVNYFPVFYENLLFVLVAAFLVFVATVRLWKLCRFATVFRIMEKSVLLSFKPIMVTCLGQIIFYIAFSFAAHMLFGDFVDYFKDIRDSLVTLFLLSMNFYKYLDLDVLKDTKPLSWGIFFGCFTVINLLFATIYIANIMICYHEAKVLDSGEDDFSNFRIFLVRELAYYKNLAKVVMARLKGGNNAKEFRLYVIPKPDENRYADCVTININKLKIMLRVVLYNLKKDSLKDKQKVQLMHQIITLHLNHSKEVEIFYGKKTEENSVKVVSDEKIKKMAKIVQKICSGDIKRRKRVSVAYQKIFDRQQRKLDFVQQMLAAMLRIMQNIEVR